MSTKLIFLVFVLVASPAVAQDLSRASFFDLTFKLSTGGRMLGEPTLTVEAGKRAVVTVDAEDIQGGYKLAVVGNPVVAENGLATLALVTTVHAQRKGHWQLVGEPSLQVTLDGERASVSVGSHGSDAADFGIEVSARIVTPAQLRERFSGEIPQTQPCDAQIEAALPGDGTVTHGCCGGTCNPPPKTMTYCGALACCACGVCCQVQ